MTYIGKSETLTLRRTAGGIYRQHIRADETGMTARKILRLCDQSKSRRFGLHYSGEKLEHPNFLNPGEGSRTCMLHKDRYRRFVS